MICRGDGAMRERCVPVHTHFSRIDRIDEFRLREFCIQVVHTHFSRTWNETGGRCGS